ncbi:hypothetical protein H6G35_31355 [Aulosira sp. FACHB-113]|uniref:hypothetical protein n=1 Tax=Tolypothrix tenuis TaxID=457083 RepID=UPI0016882B9C|nr:hypothetical protein [Aulosira sp. FACHB-113]
MIGTLLAWELVDDSVGSVLSERIVDSSLGNAKQAIVLMIVSNAASCTTIGNHPPV